MKSHRLPKCQLVVAAGPTLLARHAVATALCFTAWLVRGGCATDVSVDLKLMISQGKSAAASAFLLLYAWRCRQICCAHAECDYSHILSSMYARGTSMRCCSSPLVSLIPHASWQVDVIYYFKSDLGFQASALAQSLSWSTQQMPSREQWRRW